jgi:hypothetical protein
MPLDDLEALTWLRSQPEGRVAANAAKNYGDSTVTAISHDFYEMGRRCVRAE